MYLDAYVDVGLPGEGLARVVLDHMVGGRHAAANSLYGLGLSGRYLHRRQTRPWAGRSGCFRHFPSWGDPSPGCTYH